MNNRNKDPHPHASLPSKLAAADWVNRSKSLLEKDPSRAQRLISKGLQLAPELGAAYFNMGLSLHQQARPTAAIRAYRQALRYSEGDDLVTQSAQNNLAQDLLLVGEYHEGWQRYEDRLDTEEHRFFQDLCGEPWKGMDDPRLLNRLVLVAEQGLGDTLMFCRLGLDLQEYLDRPVTLFCQEKLVPLLRQASSINEVTAEIKSDAMKKQKGQLWCPLMSVPSRWNLNPTKLEERNPYLKLPPEEVERWRIKLNRSNGKRLIALHWQGNPRHEGSLYSKGRSMHLSDMSGLKELRQVEFVSIQKGAGSEQLKENEDLPFVAGQGEVSKSMDFIDTAAILANCDLLISADSGVVHLAGALGIPTWVALCFVPEWRWALKGKRTPWYPSVRLFRQPKHGDWQTVVAEMTTYWEEDYEQ